MKIFLSGAKEKKYRRRGVLCGILAAWVLLAGGCTFLSQEKIKLRDLDFTVLSEEKIPEQLSAIIEEKKESAFQITYTDNANLYICIGYGKQETGGYSIAVNALYETENAVYFDTTLLGPKPGENDGKKQSPSYPYVVVKTEMVEKPVVFD